jgi:hypothetical protein
MQELFSVTMQNAAGPIAAYLFPKRARLGSEAASVTRQEDFGLKRIYPVDGAKIPELSSQEQAEVDQLITTSGLLTVANSYDQLTEQFAADIGKIQARPQFALVGETKLRGNNLDNDYQVQLIFDKGFLSSDNRMSKLTLNASYGRKLDDMSVSQKGLRLSAKYLVPPKEKPSDKKPANRLSFAAEADRAVAKPVYKAQIQYIIPIRQGVEIPLSLTWANRAEFVNEGKVIGHIGVTFDLDKLKVSDLLPTSPKK